MRKKTLTMSLVLVLMIGMGAGACGGEEVPPTEEEEEVAPPVGPYGTLRVSLSAFSESFDPIDGFWFGWSMYDPLLTWDENFEICGAIAKDWTISDDGLTWTFEIREGVKFHNGDLLTSADVMFSVEHMQDPTSMNPWSPYLSYNFDTMYCPDDYTFVYKTVEPELSLAIVFTAVLILPKDYIETNGIDYFREHPIGSGPWKYVDGSFVSETRVEFEANTEHWLNVPHFERLIQYVSPEEFTRVAMLKSGEVDIIDGISLDGVADLRDEGWALQPVANPTGVWMCMPGTWLTDKPTSDIRVRRALAYSINYQELCDTFFQGFAEPGGRWFMHSGSWGWDDDWEPEEYDMTMARSLLEEAGYPDAFDDPVIDIYVLAEVGWMSDMMQLIQGYWAGAGIQTEIHVVDIYVRSRMFFTGAVDPAGDNIGAIIPVILDISAPNNVYHSYNMYCPGGVHSTSNDAHAAELYTKAVRETDPDLCEQYWTEFQAYVHDELFVNFGVCLVWNQHVLGPEVGDFGYGSWVNLAYGYAGIQHK